jgi:hypothetical protein
MIISTDKFLDRVPSKHYNCFDFVREVWLDWTGEDIAVKLVELKDVFRPNRPSWQLVKGFSEISKPISPCFVVMQRRYCVPHVAIYLDRHIFHLSDTGAQLQPLSVAKGYFKTIRYYQ